MSNRFLKVFIKLWILVTVAFLLLDLVTSFIGIFNLISDKTPLIFKIIISFCLALSAIIANGIGKIFAAIAKDGFSVQVYSEKNGYQDIVVTSKVVYILVGLLPGFLAVFDWFTSFIGICLIFSSQSVAHVNQVYGVFMWFVSQFNENLVLAFTITITTIFSSCAPYLLLRLGECEEYIKFTAQAKKEKMNEDQE